MKKAYLLLSVLFYSTLSFSQTLSVPNGTSGITNSTNTFVGIGTDSPKSFLDVRTTNQSGLIATFLSNAGIPSDIGEQKWTLRIGREYSYPSRTLDFGMVADGYAQSPDFYIAPSGTEVFRVKNNGYVGIGETSPDFPLQIRTPNETVDPISFGLDITRVNNGSRGLSFGMATDNSYSVIGAHNADLRLGHTFNTGSGGQPIFHPDLTIKHTDQNIGNVGIGTTNPSQRLEVNGNIALDNFQILSQGGSSVGFGSGGIGNEDDDITIDIANDGELELHRDGINVFSIGSYVLIDRTNSRNVGIGVENPKSKLAVNGQIRATEVKVLSDISVPDYVFEPDYELRTLKETKEYINEHKHLPEIPSASEIGENGIDLGDMNMRLLKKIEELTLYQIELLERLEKAEQEISELKNK